MNNLKTHLDDELELKEGEGQMIGSAEHESASSAKKHETNTRKENTSERSERSERSESSERSERSESSEDKNNVKSNNDQDERSNEIKNKEW